MRILGIDFGDRRIGVAISDSDGHVSTPLETVLRTDDDSALQALREIVRREQIGGLVVGEPRRLDGTRGAAAERAATFARKLVAASGLPCEMVDEALTSVEARQRLRAAGVDPRQHPERVDSLAAQILLQEALDRRRGS
jgi:putative Holliday junction resolvase